MALAVLWLPALGASAWLLADNAHEQAEGGPAAAGAVLVSVADVSGLDGLRCGTGLQLEVKIEAVEPRMGRARPG